MAKASQIASHTEEAEITAQGVPISLRYYPERFTPQVLRVSARILSLRTVLLSGLGDVDKLPEDEMLHLLEEKLDRFEQQQLAATGDLAEAIAHLVARWDLEEDQEEPPPDGMVALVPERLAKFGFVFLAAILEALMGRLSLMGEARDVRQNGHTPPISGAKARRRR